MLPRHEPQLAIMSVFQPTIIEMVAQPLAPAALHGHAPPDRDDGEYEAGSEERDKTQRLRPELHSILSLDCVEEVAVPEVQPILVQQLEEHSGNQQCNP